MSSTPLQELHMASCIAVCVTIMGSVLQVSAASRRWPAIAIDSSLKELPVEMQQGPQPHPHASACRCRAGVLV